MKGTAVGQSAVVDVVDLDPEGGGIGSFEGRPITIADVVRGEQVEVRVRDGARAQRRADLIQVLRPSPHRVEPTCRHAGVCGGCAWQHIAYGEQLRLKQERLQRLLAASLGERAPRVEPVIGMIAPAGERRAPGFDPLAPWHFRHKASFVFGPGGGGRSLVMGHYRRGSKLVVPVDECPVHAEAGNAVAFTVRDALLAARVPGASDDGRFGVARHVVVRVAHNRREVAATLVVTANDKSLRGAVRRITGGADPPDGLHLNVHDGPGPFLFGRSTRTLHGRDRLREQIAGVSFLVSPTAFFQTNVLAAEVLVEAVSGEIAGGPSLRVFDLYAGAGLFALPLARQGHDVTAVEEDAKAIEDGLASRRFSRIPDRTCRFVRGTVEDVVAGGTGGILREAAPDVVVLDPPRAGCPERVLRAILNGLRPARLVYVSCNPAALARDLGAAVAGGYRINRILPVDMFPHTAHIEAVAWLTR